MLQINSLNRCTFTKPNVTDVIDKEKRFQILEQTGGVIILAENFPEILDGDLYNY
jgi:hypothetical protein